MTLSLEIRVHGTNNAEYRSQNGTCQTLTFKSFVQQLKHDA